MRPEVPLRLPSTNKLTPQKERSLNVSEDLGVFIQHRKVSTHTKGQKILKENIKLVLEQRRWKLVYESIDSTTVV